MPENFTKKYTINVIMLDLSQKGSNYARIMLKIVSVKSLCQKNARSGRSYARIMLDRSNYARSSIIYASITSLKGAQKASDLREVCSPGNFLYM